MSIMQLTCVISTIQHHAVFGCLVFLFRWSAVAYICMQLWWHVSRQPYRHSQRVIVLCVHAHLLCCRCYMATCIYSYNGILLLPCHSVITLLHCCIAAWLRRYAAIFLLLLEL